MNRAARFGLVLALVLAGAAGGAGHAQAAAAGAPAATSAATARPATAAPAAALSVLDDTGVRVQLAGPAQRIVSLAPGATEMLFAAGAGERIVATVYTSDEPAAAKRIPRIGDANALDYEKLISLRPDVVVAWEDLTNRLVIDSLRKLKMNLYLVRARSLADIPQSVRRFGALAGTEAIAKPAAAALEARVARLTRRKADAAPLRVFYMIWDAPLYTVGSRHIITDAIARCGGRNIFDDIDFPAPIVEIESVVKRNPELMLLSAPPITARDWRERWNRFGTIRAVKAKQLVTFSDTRLDRMGPTAIDAVEGLCGILDTARTHRAD